jgi:hypothetical protein
MLVVGGDVADRGVQPDGVVLAAEAGELGVERGRVADLREVRPVGHLVFVMPFLNVEYWEMTKRADIESYVRR